jgi:hypothetical protein
MKRDNEAVSVSLSEITIDLQMVHLFDKLINYENILRVKDHHFLSFAALQQKQIN